MVIIIIIIFVAAEINIYHLQSVRFESVWGLFLVFVHYPTASRYGAILIPSSPGALHDLAQNTELAKLLNAFIHEKSECTICVFNYRH